MPNEKDLARNSAQAQLSELAHALLRASKAKSLTINLKIHAPGKTPSDTDTDTDT